MSFLLKIDGLDEKKKDVLIVLLLIIIGIFLRPLPEIGTMGRDETSYAFLAKHFLDGTFLDDYIFIAFHPFYSFIVAIVSMVGIDIELAGRIVSYSFSILSIIPIYFIGKTLLNQVVGFFAGFMTATFPPLIKWSIIVQAQSIYSFMLIMSVLFLIFAIKKENNFFYIFSGIFLSFAYLSRAEAIGIFAGNILLLFYILCKNAEKRKKTAIGLFLFIISFIIIASPYIYALKLKTGSLKFTNKLYTQIRQAVIVHYGLDYEKLNFGGMDLPKKDVITLALLAYPEKLIEGFKNLPNYFGIVALLGVLLSFFMRFYKKISIKGFEIFLPYIYVIFILPFFFVAENYFIPYAPLVFVIAGYGFYNISFIWDNKFKKIALFVFLLLISYENIFHSKIKNFFVKPVVKQDVQSIVYSSYKDFGREISRLIEPNSKIMTRFNIVAWYAGGEYVGFPDVSWDEFIRNIDNYKVDYIVIGPAEINARPEITKNLYNYALENRKFKLQKASLYQNFLEFYLIKVEK